MLFGESSEGRGGGAAAVPSLWQQQQTGIIAEKGWNEARMSVADWDRCRASPKCLIIPMNRHTSEMKCSWNDENNHFQCWLKHQGLSRDQDPAVICCPGQAQGQNSKAKQLPGMQNHQDSWIQQSPGPPDNFPHWVRAQNEVAGIAHVLLAGLTLHTEREGRFMHCIPAWSIETAKIIQIYFSPSNDFNRLLNKTSNPSL